MVDGVLGGFGHLTPVDVHESNLFLDSIQQKYPFVRYDDVADCGAGIGRVTKHLLLPRCTSSVTLVEQSPRLLQSASEYVGTMEGKRIAFLQQGLQVSCSSDLLVMIDNCFFRSLHPMKIRMISFGYNG